MTLTVFENRDHDFPQKISYQRKGATLTAVVEGETPGSGFTVRMTMVKGD